MIRFLHILILTMGLTLALIASPASAKPSQQDVFKSIQDSVGPQNDESSMRAIPWICGGVGLIIVLAIFGKRQTRQATPKTVNSNGKLIREVMKAIPLKPKELKQLKIVAEQTPTDDGEPLTNPLVLLLCPSVVIKAVNERTTRADRQALVTVLKKMGIR